MNINEDNNPLPPLEKDPVIKLMNSDSFQGFVSALTKYKKQTSVTKRESIVTELKFPVKKELFIEQVFLPLAAASKESVKEPIEKTSSNGEFCYKILTSQNEVFITVNILAENSSDYENRRATVIIGTVTVLSELIEDGVADIVLDKRKTNFDLNQPITVKIE